MKLIRIATLVLFILSAGLCSNAQCKVFAKSSCLPELESYTHDGNYHAAVLVEGEEAELYKTFYSDMEYRLAVCGEENLPSVEFVVMDASKNVLYSNKESNYAKTWDFKLQESQQLKVVLKVSNSVQKDTTKEPASGCVAIMFGFKLKE